ncbi:Uma2 family endonuclease [Pannus brasiliensis CCIBt3594]|uniref:Uma2 family endonuclease n=1 Tax=Pannus brasiliensis CCIBt3594 TaxID=1427578 RepID=A0AAW9QXW1_9CHRO
MVTLQLKQVTIPAGGRVFLTGIGWREFEEILEELGESRSSRLAYYQGTLEIIMPLPEHEKVKVIIGNLLAILLDELSIDWEPYGSTTFKRQDMNAGIEPDDCFSIQNASRMIGKRRIDLAIDPPPDLAIEVDVTSKTQLSAYEALGVPEIWRYENNRLKISILRDGQYLDSPISPTFLDFPVLESIERFLAIAFSEGTSSALRDFRRWIRERKQD